jgi:hypothetical protein
VKFDPTNPDTPSIVGGGGAGPEEGFYCGNAGVLGGVGYI